MVAAIASQTLRNSDLETARSAFTDRLMALSQAHDILNKTRWTAASMHQVIENTIAAFPISQISISGPPLSINPKMALSLALAVNELGTNALKYGALSTPAGAVAIEWAVYANVSDEATGLTWRWRETGGPTVKLPSRRGFGTILIEQVLAADFNGSVWIEYHPAGVECVLTAPVPAAVAMRSHSD
jgi:two-component sensor histidine kinase